MAHRLLADPTTKDENRVG